MDGQAGNGDLFPSVPDNIEYGEHVAMSPVRAEQTQRLYCIANTPSHAMPAFDRYRERERKAVIGSDLGVERESCEQGES